MADIQNTIVTIVNQAGESQQIAVKDIQDPVLKQRMVDLLSNPVVKAAQES